MIVDDTTLLYDIVNKWNVGEIIKITKTTEGIFNTNWIITTTQGTYILKKLEEVTNTELHFEFDYLHYLQQNNFPYQIPEALINQTGSKYTTHFEHYYWLYKFIVGRITDVMEQEQITEVAHMVARYHNLLEQSTYSYGPMSSELYNKWVVEELEGYLRQLKQFQKYGKEEHILEKYGNKLLEIAQELQQTTARGLECFPIHRDLGGDNLVWEENKLVGILDFENVAKYKEPLVKDLDSIIMYSCRKEDEKPETDLQKVELLLQEYTKVRSLSQKDLEQLPKILVHGMIEDFNFMYWLMKHKVEKGSIERMERYAQAALWHYEKKEDLEEFFSNFCD